MGQALYRKYRPKSLSEIAGQEHITVTLSNAIKNGKISHAYLLTGPRGVGKTSIARILAHEVNGLPYNDESIHLDIIEIDAASNRRIDEIRNLRDKVHVLPTSATYKVYIIDEVHMLTREAFNALLKTLEEPPAHAIFILATTEVHKLPETIVSRTQHYSFKPIDAPTVVAHLKTITESEHVTIDDNALELVAEHGDGSFRDSISLLDQARSISDHITESQVQQLLGIAPTKALDELLEILSNGTPKELFESLQRLRDQGLQSSMIARQLGQRLRIMMLDDKSLQNIQTTQLLQSLLSVQASAQPDRLLEITLLEYIFLNNPGEPTQEPTSPEKITETRSLRSNEKKTDEEVKEKQVEKVASKPTKEDVKIKDTTELKSETEKVAQKPSIKKQEINESKEGFTAEAWPIIVAQVKKTNNTLYGILKMAEMSYKDHTITLRFKFAFHQKQINDAKNKKIIEDIITKQTGDTVEIKCESLSSSKPGSKSNTLKTSDLDTVSNIFGGAEVLES